jgi:hypothetical protein
MLPLPAGNRKIWAAIAIYIFAIYITLPVMRPFLGLLYSSIGRETVSLLVNGALVLISVLIAVVFSGKGLIKLLLVALPMALVAIFVFMMELPEERVHFLEYGALGFLVIRAVGQGHRQIAFSFVFIILTGAVDEFIQMMLPNRVGDLRDVIMNAAGGTLGLWIGRIWYWR